MTQRHESDLAELIRERDTPFEIVGGATRRLGPPLNLEPIRLEQFDQITLYEPGALTLVAEAGVPLRTVEAVLKEKGQMLPFEPNDLRGLLQTSGEPTLGGMVATNASGPRRVKVGACRDYVLGLRFISGEGKILKTGGRVMKNVTGYDLAKLLTGSYGTLGVITEVALKVLPAPEHTAVILIENLSENDALKVLRKALASPYEVSGASHLVSGLDDNPVTMIRVEGFVESVNYRIQQLTKLLSSHGEINVESDPRKTEQGWQYVRDIKPFWNLPGDVWCISTRPSDALGLVNRIREQAESEVFYDWGGGLVWISVQAGTPLRQVLGNFTGHATLIRSQGEANGNTPVFHPQEPVQKRLMDHIRQKFDPKQLFNRGLSF